MPERALAARDVADPITASVKDFCSMSGLPRGAVYTLLKLGSIRSIKIGKRRMIVLESYRELIYREGGGASSPSDAPYFGGDVTAHNGTKRTIRRKRLSV
jgi:hypothetical protein